MKKETGINWVDDFGHPIKLDPAFKERWVKALRSGDYAQTQSSLRTTKGFCCLGVACDLIDASAWEVREVGYEFVDESGEEDNLPTPDAIKYMFDEHHGRYFEAAEKVVMNDLATKNDAGQTFAEIADEIEERL